MYCLANQCLGLPNDTTNALYSSRIFAVEFDTVQNQNLELHDINDNHVGIDISSLVQTYPNQLLTTTQMAPLTCLFFSRMEIQFNLSPLGLPRPRQSLISLPIEISLRYWRSICTMASLLKLVCL
ncbi:hypothetical protein Dsin_032194 [Dipteronia sinensis]|uniref:Legume lectin domain-containing protein n=1 Tax=Dipteronia sinensis TaxID=43782 RepID=A0AAE0DSY2_9ROSI|nr:hypothetical protein Dsin_032194 [Dipteronia sinensis]